MTDLTTIAKEFIENDNPNTPSWTCGGERHTQLAEGFLALQAECEKEKGWKETFMDLVEGETKLNERWQAEHHEISKRCQALQAENERLREALTNICEELAPGTDWGSSMCDTINDIARAALKLQGKGEG